MTSGYYLNTDGSGNLGFFLLSSGAELMYLNDVGDLSIDGSFSASSYNLTGGTGISFSGVTITNTGVVSLQGDTGSLSLTAGTGISISGLTISNAGIVSASAGSGISVSGSNPLTITNTGVLSLQGDTGDLSLSAGTGIGISGLTITNDGIVSASAGNGISTSGTNPLTISMKGSYSGNFSVDGSLTISGTTYFSSTTSPAYSNLGTLDGSAVGSYTASVPFGSVVLSSGNSFTNGTGGTILVIFAAQNNTSLGNPSSATSGVSYLAPASGTTAYVHFMGLPTGDSITYSSDAVCYTWFLMN